VAGAIPLDQPERDAVGEAFFIGGYMMKFNLDIVKSILHYDKDTGFFVYKISAKGKIKGDRAEKKDKKGYLYLNILSTHTLAHRLAFMFVHGDTAKGFQIDHINGVRNDNRICNLRKVSHAVNCQNQRRPANRNKSGYLGVSWHKGTKKFQARISLNGIQKFLGNFSDPKDAHEVYLKWKRMVHEGCTI